uniref:Uncharacterized protein n=1 Tax=candidate division CPR3 bacterium TaxID=2268181 RepID=A0A7C4M5X4_UNCC3
MSADVDLYPIRQKWIDSDEKVIPLIICSCIKLNRIYEEISQIDGKEEYFPCCEKLIIPVFNLPKGKKLELYGDGGIYYIDDKKSDTPLIYTYAKYFSKFKVDLRRAEPNNTKAAIAYILALPPETPIIVL